MPQLPTGPIKDRAIKIVEELKSKSNKDNEDQHNLFIELFELYSLKSRQQDIEPWLSKLKPTAAFEFVERAFAALASNTPSFEIQSTSSDTPKVELEPEIVDERSLGGDGSVLREAVEIPFGEVYEADLMQIFHLREMKKFLRQWVKSCLIYGTAPCEVELNFVARKEYEALFEEGNEETDEVDFTMIIDKITPRPVLLENFDLLVHPFATDAEDAIENYGGFGVTKNNVSLRDLDEDTYGNLDLLKETISSAQSNNKINDDKDTKQKIVSPTANEDIAGTFTVDEVFAYFSDDDRDFEPKRKIIAVANGVLIRFEDADDESPYIIMKDQEVPNQFWGIGEIEPIKEEIYEETTIRNQRVDMNNRLLNEDWLMRSDSGIDPRSLVSGLQRIIIGEDISDGAIRNVQRNTAGLATSGEDLDRLRRTMSTATGSVDTIASQGNLGGDTKTATGERIREQNAIARYNAKAENIEFSVAELARKMLKAKADHLNENDKVPVFLRGKWREVPASLYKEYIDKHIFRVRSGSMNVQNSITERNKKITLKNILLEAKQVGLNPDLMEAYRTVLADFPGVDVDKLLPKENAQPAEPEQAAGPSQPSLEGVINELPGQLPGPQLATANAQQQEQANPLA